MPQSIVVVGGSIAGLMHGLQLKREGNNVTILEREPVSQRSSHVAGVGYKAGMEEFLGKFDDTGMKSAFVSTEVHLAYHRRPNVYKAKSSYKLTSWGLLYRILRANFDGFASKACPQPPTPRAGDGNAVYLVGKHVSDLEYSDGVVTIHYSDVNTGKTDSLVADFVIGADGIHSTVREIVKAPFTKEYSGYVAWRGAVPERELSKATAEYLINGLSMNFISRSYAVCYVIPTDDGGFEPGDRLANLVWYYNVAEGSPTMKEIFTDKDGKFHKNTVGQGLVSPAVWDHVRTTGLSQMAAPFAEVLNKMQNPFVTKVNDVLCTAPRHWDGRVLLVGDALTTFRPHVAMATEQAAKHCLWMGMVRNGDMSVADWEAQTAIFAKRIYLLSRMLGLFGQRSMILFAQNLFSFLWFIIRLRFGKAQPRLQSS